MHRVTFQSTVYYQFHSLLSCPQVTHGIFTRLGGHSRSPWASLNAGHTVGDDPVTVDANHELICQALGFKIQDIVSPHQVHGTTAGIVNECHKGRLQEETDALLTAVPGVLLMLRFADCTPIILYDPRQRIVGLVHAGWRGTVARIAQTAVEKMTAAFGSRPADILAGIGPAIGPCCYEIGEDVVEAANRAFPNQAHLFLVKANGRWRLDMWAANRQQLCEAGVRQVEVAETCTACRTDEWFSHRAEGGKTGRFAVAIALRTSNLKPGSTL